MNAADRAKRSKPKVAPGDGFSIPYRMWFTFEYGMMHIYGPASLSESQDPRKAMKRDYERRRQLWLERKANRT